MNKSPQDFELAEHAYVRACDQDHAQACLAVASILCDDRSARRDERRCFELTEKACRLGLQEGCRSVADFYQMGSTDPGIVAKDPGKAFQLYKGYCEAGDAISCDSLATCYELGLGVKRNAVLARQFHRRAEQLGYVGE